MLRFTYWWMIFCLTLKEQWFIACYFGECTVLVNFACQTVCELLWLNEMTKHFVWLRWSDLSGESKQRCLLGVDSHSGPQSGQRPGSEEWGHHRVAVHRVAAAEPHHWRGVWLQPQHGQVNATETRSRKSNQSESWLRSISLRLVNSSNYSHLKLVSAKDP